MDKVTAIRFSKLIKFMEFAAPTLPAICVFIEWHLWLLNLWLLAIHG